MKFLEKIDDALNPIVVKELRQAVQSRFVVAVLLLFLLIQLVYMGIYLVATGISGRLDSTEFQAGRDVFSVLQGILLATCMLFIPAYTGFRLAAERSDVNVDLLFVSTLRPRAIISGKFVAAMILALLIFSACTPFMTFTYFLRGIDMPSIFFVITLDYLAVTGAVMLAIFLAVVPANRVLKVLLGLMGLIALLYIFGMTIAGSVSLLNFGLGSMMENREFWAVCIAIALAILGTIGLFFTWSVALLSPPSANRALPSRLMVTALWLISGGVLAYCEREIGHEGPFYTWIIFAALLLSLSLIIAINERESWAPRVARTIPRFFLLRPLAFLFYSGAAGGVLLASVLFGLTWLGIYMWDVYFPAGGGRFGYRMDELRRVSHSMTMIFLYTYCYGLTAVIMRNYFLRTLHAVYTWVLFIFLMALGSALPFLFVILSHQRDYRFETHFYWLLPNPGAAVVAVTDSRFPHRYVFFTFILVWTALVTALCVPWFFKQIRRFRPYAGRKAAIEPPPVLVAVADDETETSP